MVFDKVKTLRAAERCLEMGKIPSAIIEYYKIVESDPNDLTTLNMLGDLYVRVGNHAAAINCFQRIAEHYREQDFVLKAIAMYKKIDRLRANDIEIATCLADLYASQGLVVEARAHYLVVADAHNKSGATREGLDVLRKIADLDPQNTQIRTKLAEGYLNEGMTTEAASCFSEAGLHFLARGECDEALEVFGKAIEICPGNHSTLKGLLATHSARGTADEAVEVIARASVDSPDDNELLSMLAKAYVEAEDPVNAEQATAALVAKEPAAYLRFIEAARLYLRGDRMDDAVRVIASITEQMLAEREDNQLLELVNELLATNSDHVQALRLLVRAHWWQRDTEKLKAALERLAEAAQAAGLEKDERYALTQLVRLAPDQASYSERLKELGGAEEDVTDEVMPEIESVAEPFAANSVDEVSFESQQTDPVYGEFELEWNSLPETFEQSQPQVSAEQGFTFETVVAEELSSSPEDIVFSGSAEANAASESDESRKDAMRAQELESVDFYIAQGYFDIALDTLNLLETQFGPHPDIDVRKRRVQSATESPQATSEAQFTMEDRVVTQVSPAEKPESIVAPDEKSDVKEHAKSTLAAIDPGLAEVFEEYRAAAEDDDNIAGNGDFETHYNLGLAYNEMDLFEEALEEFQTAVSLVAPGDGTSRYLQCCNLLGHCFMQKGVPQLAINWFDKGLKALDASEDERQALRYELAAAYEQSGDLNRAIELFTEVYGIDVSYRSVNERLRKLQSRVSEEGSNGRLVR